MRAGCLVGLFRHSPSPASWHSSLDGVPVAQRGYTYDGPLENVVVDWNRHTVEALINAATGEPAGAGQPPPISSLYLAMVHGTVYGVVLAIDQRQQAYLPGLPAAPRSASKAAAVATAAHDVLVGVVLPTPLSPAIIDRLHAARDATLAAATAVHGAAAVANGVTVGKAGAALMLAARANEVATGRTGGKSRPIPAGSGSSRATASRCQPVRRVRRSSRSSSRARRNSGRRGRRADELCLCEGIRRGEGPRGQDRQYAHPRAGGARPVLQPQPHGVALPRVPHARGGEETHPYRQARLFAMLSRRGGQPDHLLGRQGALEFLAPDHRDPER